MSGSNAVAGGGLTGCTVDVEGVLQMFSEGQWRTVCKQGFDSAKLACSSIGHWGGVTSSLTKTMTPFKPFGTDLSCGESYSSLGECSFDPFKSCSQTDAQSVLCVCSSSSSPGS